ncbi:hypothetical protein [Lactococcus lactis]|uniref:Uncharacterized protein n=1 Tax=Lactococcus lactis TaxID=1358 RepID=A0AAW5TPJ3_9LACT|nr:hypothetical protein [Lactococcus lactis]MCW2280167.1 hypothetical protein [Lactococcus lactis]
MTETYHYAYSTELQRYLEPLEAHQYSINSKLHSKYHFQCGEFCRFKLTLVNFGKEKFIQPPHYRSSTFDQIHEPGCQVVKEHYEARKGTHEVSQLWSRSESKVIVEINLIKGLLAKIKNSESLTNPTNPSEIFSLSNNTTKDLQVEKDKKIVAQHIKSLKKLIKLYLSYLQGEQYQFLDINNQKIDLNSYFIKLGVFKMITPNKIGIYYGQAKVYSYDKIKSPYFHVRFTSPCRTLNLREISPSVNINKEKALHRGVKGKILQLEKLSKSKKPFLLFYFGSFIEKEEQYLNFARKSEEILDYFIFES